MTLDQKIEMYFAPPNMNRESYISRFKAYYKPEFDHTPFSPLYLDRQHLFYALGINPYTLKDFATEMGFGPMSSLVAPLLVSIAQSLGGRVFGNSTAVFTQWMNFSKDYADALSELRNAPLHSLSPLETILRNGGKYSFTLGNHFPESITKHLEDKDGVLYFVNPRLLVKEFELAMANIRRYLVLPDSPERASLDKHVKIDQWLMFDAI